jgi:hypothetical protein
LTLTLGPLPYKYVVGGLFGLLGCLRHAAGPRDRGCVSCSKHWRLGPQATEPEPEDVLLASDEEPGEDARAAARI